MRQDSVHLGSLETEIVRCVSDNPDRSGREIAAALADERGVARTTVLTVLERLRTKGMLSRRKRGGVYRYRSEMPASQAMQGTVQRFVDHILGGSVSPVLAFLADADRLTDEEIDELEQLVKGQRERRQK
ncbi:MAG: BlaI/MecI/CopY family transcriptional regulator [Fimbriimonadales bacterium]